MDFPRLPSRRLRLPTLTAIAVLLATPAGADTLKGIGSGFDEAGRALNRQVGEWFGPAKPARTVRRRALPATAPLPLPRPAEESATAATSASPAPAPETPTATAPTPPAAPDAVRVAALPAPFAPPRGDEKPLPQDRRQAAASTEDAGKEAAGAEDGSPDHAAENATPSTATPSTATPTTAATPEKAAVPLPPARPSVPAQEQAQQQEKQQAEQRVAALPPPAPAPESAPAGPSKAAMPTICPELSADDLGEFTPVTVTATQAACAVDRGVSLSAVRMKDGRLVPLEPAAVLRCEMAASVAHWLREKVDPSTATLGSKLAGVMVAASQQCRPRNRVAGAKISEHGRGNAIDLRGLALEDGRRVVIGTPASGASREVAMPIAFRETLKTDACADFTTILGPGSDGYHEQHLHLDRAQRRSGAVLCQWAVAGPPPKAPESAPAAAPTPPARPADAPPKAGETPADATPAPPKPAP